MASASWRALSRFGEDIRDRLRYECQRAAILVGTAIEVVATAVALAELIRRRRAPVRRPKPQWVPGCIVQPVGPIAYLVFGPRSS
jgi:hypothetical protein